MWNLKVSTLPLSSLLGSSRFRSGRFGGGRAAGELVLDCQSCPVYHLDELIVLQSQLSSLENCVDLHSKKPQRQLHLGCIRTSGDNDLPITLPPLPITFFTFVTHRVCEWKHTCMHTNTNRNTNVTWQCSPYSQYFESTLQIYPELHKVVSTLNIYGQSH